MIVTVNLRFVTKLSVLLLILLPVAAVSAAEYTVRPFLIDKVGQPRDVITENALLTNNSAYRKYVVYATVNEISIDTTGEIKEFVSPVMTDRSSTVTSWIEVTRGRIEIPPGEQKEVPITLRVNPYAEPGEYHAFVGFVPAPNRPAAEALAMAGEADGVIVKLTIADKRTDSMKISGFLIDRFVTNEDSRRIDVEIQNVGDVASAPKGEIIFYDSRGVEIDSTPFNEEGIAVPPGKTITLQSIVPLKDDIGRFKANLSLRYGENQQASLYDTSYFYLLPSHLLLLLFGAILIGAIVITLLFRRAFMATQGEDETGDDVMLYVRDGHDPNPQDHDIDLKNTTSE